MQPTRTTKRIKAGSLATLLNVEPEPLDITQMEQQGNLKYLGTVYRGQRWTTAMKPMYTPADAYKLKLMMEYSRKYSVHEVPDPYSGGPEGFELVLEMLEDATEGLLLSILNEQKLRR